MMIANKEIRGVMAVTEVNPVTLTMVTTDTVQLIFLLHPHHHLQTTTAATNPLVAHLDLRVAATKEMLMAGAEVPHHPHRHYLPSHNHLKASQDLLPHKAIPRAMAVAAAETAASKAKIEVVMTTTVGKAVATEQVEEETMAMEVDTEEEAVEMMMEDVVSSKGEKHKPRTKDVRKGREGVRVSLVDMRARGEDSRILSAFASVSCFFRFLSCCCVFP
jgi:hypothetical protein